MLVTEHKISLSTTTIPTTTTVPTTAAVSATTTVPTMPTIPTATTTIPTTATTIRTQVVTSTAAPTEGDKCGLEGSKLLAKRRFRPNAILVVRPWVLEVEG